MLVKKLFKVNRFCILDDDAQVLEAGQRVLLGVQHLLGGLLHVPVRLLREHPAAAAAPPGRVPPAERRRWAGKRLSRGGSGAPPPRGPRCQARLAPPPPPPLHGTCGSGSNMADPPRALQRQGGAERGAAAQAAARAPQLRRWSAPPRRHSSLP